MGARAALDVLDAGLDFVMIGRAAILQNDFPQRVRANPDYISPSLPVSADYLVQQGLSPEFISYMRNWDGFVAN